MQFIAVEVFIYLFTVFISNHKAQFICVKDRARLEKAITANYFNIFWIILVSCFVYLLKK